MGNGLRNKHRRLTAAEEQDLARRVQSGDRAAVNELAKCNIALARRIAFKYRPNRTVDADDIVQLAMLGLLRAAEGFEPRGLRFSTYAAPWVRSRIQEGLRRGENITTGMERDRVTHSYRRRNETGVNFDDEQRLQCEPELTEDEIDETRRRVYVAAAVERLPDRLRSVIKMQLDGMTMQEIGDRIGVCRERVRQLQLRAVDRLRVMVPA